MPEEAQDTRNTNTNTHSDSVLSIKALFADYETADEEVAHAQVELANAILRRSTAVERIADVTGKEGTKKWRGRDGKPRQGRIVRRGDTWFFKGAREKEQDYSD